MVNCKVQGDNTVASMGILFYECGCIGRAGIGISMPGIAVAGRLAFNAGIAVVNREVQSNHTVASMGILLCESGCIGRACIGMSMPSVAVAGNLAFDSGIAVVNNKVKCYHTVTSRNIVLHKYRNSSMPDYYGRKCRYL